MPERCRMPEHLAALLRDGGQTECECWAWFKPEAGLTKCETCDPEGWAPIMEKRRVQSELWLIHVWLHSGVAAMGVANGTLPPDWIDNARLVLTESGIDPDSDPRETGRA